jgi:hypothetical protein
MNGYTPLELSVLRDAILRDLERAHRSLAYWMSAAPGELRDENVSAIRDDIEGLRAELRELR